MWFLRIYSKYIFLVLLFFIIIGSFNFRLINNHPISIEIKNIIFFSYPIISLLTIIFGILSFYFGKDKIKENDAEEEYKILEDKRVYKFSYLFPEINEIPVVNKIALWIYKERFHGIAFISILILFIITRFYNNDFVNGSDNHNVIGIKNLYENGLSFYRYHPITDFFMLWSVKIFDFNFLSIKIPFITYSFITLIFIYLTGRIIDKKLAFLSAFLFVISPWAIIQSKITRDYSFDLMIGSIAIYLSIILYIKIENSEKIKEFLKYILLFGLIPISIILLYKYNRVQVITTGIYPLSTAIFIGLSIIKKFKCNALYVKIAYWINIIASLLAFFYISENLASFEFGFRRPDYIFLDVFFNPLVKSPYQWFSGLYIGKIILISLFILGIFYFGKKNKEKTNYLLILFSSFSIALFLFIFKYKSHLDYIPVRYVYFLFIPYVIIISNGILNILTLFNKKVKVIIILSFFSIINYTNMIYAISPVLAYEKGGISNPLIDNIGVGRFSTRKTAEFLKNNLKITDDTAMVFNGRYEEFILYLNRPMDKDRFLVRGKNWSYDIAKKTYVQSSYFRHFELEKAIKENNEGFYVTYEEFTYDNIGKKIYLRDGDFYLCGISFKFIKRIDEFKIYSWKINE